MFFVIFKFNFFFVKEKYNKESLKNMFNWYYYYMKKVLKCIQLVLLLYKKSLKIESLKVYIISFF